MSDSDGCPECNKMSEIASNNRNSEDYKVIQQPMEIKEKEIGIVDTLYEVNILLF